MSRKRRKLHIASWNIEGLRSRLGEEHSRASLSEVAALLGSPDVLCLQELRLRDRDHADVKTAETALPGWTLVHSLADDPKNARFRGGRTYGVGTYVRTDLSPVAVPRQPWDREGRFTMIVLHEIKLAIVNVYAVNGTSKPYWDPEAGVLDGDRHSWKRRFHEHVAASAKAAREAGLDLLLIGDWNISQQRIDTTPRLRTEEPHATSRAHFQNVVVEDLAVVDVFRALHPRMRAYTWFNRHSRRGLDAARVDFALLSRSRLREVVRVSIDEELLEQLGSDHVPIHMELDCGNCERPSQSRTLKRNGG